MTHTHKVSLLGVVLFIIFAFSLITPAQAQMRDSRERKLTNQEASASTTKKSNDRSARMRNYKMSSSTKEREEKMSSSTPRVTADAACMQTAVDTREDAVTGAWTSFSSAILAGLEDRQTSLYAAWGLSDSKSRNEAAKNSFSAWKSANKQAHEALKKSRNTAWETFKKTAKDTCKTKLPKEEKLDKEGKGRIVI